MANLHQGVGIADFHGNERVVGNLDKLRILDRGLIEGFLMQSPVELLSLLGSVFVTNAEQYKFRINEIVNRGTHGDEERVVTKLHMVIDAGKDLAPGRAGKNGRNHNHDFVFAILKDATREILDRASEIAIVEIHALFGQASDALIEGGVGRLHGDEDNLRVPNDLL